MQSQLQRLAQGFLINCCIFHAKKFIAGFVFKSLILSRFIPTNTIQIGFPVCLFGWHYLINEKVNSFRLILNM